MTGTPTGAADAVAPRASRGLVPVSALTNRVIGAFREGIGGRVIRAEDPDYEAARALWNGVFDRRPGLIVRCRDASDVAASIAFTREHDLRMAVRGGGHGVAGFASVEDGLVIDVSPMKAITVDPDQRTARAEAGLTWGDFDRATAAYGLATTGGQISSTGISGLTLGGGFGWLSRRHGLTVDSLRSVELVTADGSNRTVDDQRDPELFWGLRGGGGSFGVTTAFEYDLHAADTVLLGSWLHPAERVPSLLELYREQCDQAPDELTLMLYFLPTSPEIRPPSVQGEAAVALTAVYSGAPEVGDRLMQPLAAFGPSLAGSVERMPYATLQSLFDAAAPPGLGVYMKSCYLGDLGDASAGAVVNHLSTISSPLSHVLITQQGGMANRVDPEATAFGHRTARHIVEIIAKWKVGEDWTLHREWVRRFWADLQLDSVGEYVNFVGDEGPGQLGSAFTPVALERLLRLKREHDPENTFSRNHLGQLVLATSRTSTGPGKDG
jgi:FAD/FMN-containing dehydrogenase